MSIVDEDFTVDPARPIRWADLEPAIQEALVLIGRRGRRTLIRALRKLNKKPPAPNDEHEHDDAFMRAFGRCGKLVNDHTECWTLFQAFLTDPSRCDHLDKMARSTNKLFDLFSWGQANAAEPDLIVQKMSEIEPETVDWIWSGRIPADMLTVIAGDPGRLKTLLLVHLTAVVTTGGRFLDEKPAGVQPDQPGVSGSIDAANPTKPDRTGGFIEVPASPTADPPRKPRDVILLTGEDSLPKTLRPRLDAAGADCDRVFVIRMVDDGGLPQTFSLETHLPLLEELLEKNPEVALVIIDPISSFMGSHVDGNSNSQLRSLLTPIAELAEQHGVAIVANTHVRKADGKALYSVLGSVAVRCRTLFLVRFMLRSVG